MAPQKRTSSWITRTRIAPIAAGILGTLMLSGCISYTNFPEPESAPAFKSANHSQAIRVTRVALDEVIQRYPMRSFDGESFTGNVTIWLNGGVRAWKLNRVQHWAPGTIGIPPLYVPLPEDVLEQRDSGVDEADTEAYSDEGYEPSEGEAEIMSEPEPVRTPDPEPQQPTAQQPAAPQQGAHYREIPVED